MDLVFRGLVSKNHLLESNYCPLREPRKKCLLQEETCIPSKTSEKVCVEQAGSEIVCGEKGLGRTGSVDSGSVANTPCGEKALSRTGSTPWRFGLGEQLRGGQGRCLPWP